MSERDLEQTQHSTDKPEGTESAASSERPSLNSRESTTEQPKPEGREQSASGPDDRDRPDLPDTPSHASGNAGGLASPENRTLPGKLNEPAQWDDAVQRGPVSENAVQLCGEQQPTGAGGMSGPEATSSKGTSPADATQTADPRVSQSKDAGTPGKGPETGNPGKTGEKAGKPETPGPDGRTESQIRADLEQRSGKSYSQLVMELGRGPLDPAKISPRQVEQELESKKALPTRDTKEPTVIGNVLVPHEYQAGRYVTEGRVGPESKVEAASKAGQEAVRKDFVSGVAGGMAGGRPGSASEGLVKPAPEVSRGYEPRPAQTYEPRQGAYKPEAPSTVRSMAGPSAGEMRAAKGFQNEKAVADLTGGSLARDNRAASISAGGALKDTEIRYTLPNGQGGVAKVDVLGPKGELIQVGGPAKAENLSKTIGDLTHLQRAAESRGVNAEAYFTRDTPKAVLEAAGKVLGNDHVHTFDRPDYRFR
ncbi:hypothetical protein [Nonomuraea sp. NPDC001699]